MYTNIYYSVTIKVFLVTEYSISEIFTEIILSGEKLLAQRNYGREKFLVTVRGDCLCHQENLMIMREII